MDMFPNNCNVQEKTGDGKPVGRCWFHLEKGVCPRHGIVKIWDYLEIKQI